MLNKKRSNFVKINYVKMNKKLVLGVTLLFSLVLSSCLKDKTNTTSNCVANTTGIPTAAEIADLQAYLTSKSITATQDSRGFFYTITNAGTGVNPTLASTVVVKYVGTLTNGNEFDRNRNAGGETFPLNQLIKGWQYGIPLIKKGGSITLYLPPTLAYGCTAAGSIPPGSTLIFTIDLVDVL
jgi:FKBP-type peptidyl-prolyl cis-trans isomerase FkpA